MISSASTRVLLALIEVHRTQGRATVREVACAAGKSVQPTYRRLVELERAGLVAGVGDGMQGALRPLVADAENERVFGLESVVAPATFARPGTVPTPDRTGGETMDRTRDAR